MNKQEKLNLILEKWSRKRRPLEDTIELARDLELVGVDAADFMNEFFSEMQVTPGEFSFEDHFDQESNIVDAVKSMVFMCLQGFGWRQKSHDKLPITIGTLRKSVECGTWVNDNNQRP